MDSHGQPAPPPPAVARLTRRLGLAALFLVSAAAAWAAGMWAAGGLPVRTVPRVAVNGLSVDPDALDVGEVWETPRLVVRLRVHNDAATPRVVEKWTGGCGCTTVEPKTLSLRPGESAEVTVTIDLTDRAPRNRGVARWPLAIHLQPVFAGDRDPSAGWTIAGTVLNLLNVPVGRLDILDGCVSGGPPRGRTFHVTAQKPLARVEADLDSSYGSVRVEPAGPDRWAVTVTPSPQLPAGPFEFRVPIRAVTPDGESHPSTTVVVAGEMHPPVRAFPRTAQVVGDVTVPGPAVAEVSVTVPDGWAVARVESDAAGTDAKHVGPAPDGGRLYRITQPTPNPGGFRVGVRFVVQGPAGRTATAPVEVVGYARPAGKGGRP